MKILIYQFQDKYKALMSELSKIPGVSIYFAFSESELLKLHDLIDPDIIFRDRQASCIPVRTHRTARPVVYVLDTNQSEIQVVDETTNEIVPIDQLLSKSEETVLRQRTRVRETHGVIRGGIDHEK